MTKQTDRYHYFLIMASLNEDESAWRYRLENPRSQQQWGFTELQSVFETVDEILQEMIEKKEKQQRGALK